MAIASSTALALSHRRSSAQAFSEWLSPIPGGPGRSPDRPSLQRLDLLGGDAISALSIVAASSEFLAPRDRLALNSTDLSTSSA